MAKTIVDTNLADLMVGSVDTPGIPAQTTLMDRTVDIVAAYVGNNNVRSTELPGLIHQIHGALQKTASGFPEPEPLEPAVPIKKSVTPDYIICLEDGKRFKSLKRHLRSHYDMTPEEYREKWSLGPDYPMVAPNYAATRSELAKKMGLGQHRKMRSGRR